MLPDYPELKAKASARLIQFVRAQVPQIAPLLREISSYAQHEGKHGHLTRADKSTDTVSFPGTQIRITISQEEMRVFDIGALRAHLISMAEQMAEYQMTMMLSRVGEAAASVGNSIAVGGELTADHLLEALRRVQTDFDPSTGTRLPGQAWVMHPDQAARLIPKIQEWERDPSIIAELAKIEDIHREEWRAREARRILAD